MHFGISNHIGQCTTFSSTTFSKHSPWSVASSWLFSSGPVASPSMTTRKTGREILEPKQFPPSTHKHPISPLVICCDYSHCTYLLPDQFITSQLSIQQTILLILSPPDNRNTKISGQRVLNNDDDDDDFAIIFSYRVWFQWIPPPPARSPLF